MAGHFEGNIDARWLRDDGKDRRMRLLADFAFIDTGGFRWRAQAGDTIDGASIPEAVWSIVVGTPFIGDYRRASVVHDVACEKKIRTSRDAHRMFYEAMLADGTERHRALLFYTAVRLFGPHWSGTDTGVSNAEFKQSLRGRTAIDVARLEAALDLVDSA